jgi:hypothetical protein
MEIFVLECYRLKEPVAVSAYQNMERGSSDEIII